jgi:hypothetical protein
MVSMASITESVNKFLARSKCQKLIKYQTRSVEVKGLTAVSELHDLKLSISEFSTEVKPLVQNITETALAIDDYQYSICNNLSNPNIANNLPPDRRLQHTENLFSAHACILLYRSAFSAFMADQNGQRENLNASFKTLQNFVQSVVDQSAPKPNAEERRKKAISEVLSSIGLEDKDKDRAQLVAYVPTISNKIWSVENIEGQIRNEIRDLHSRLMHFITQNNLNSQLPNGDSSSILEIVDILIKHGIISGQGREFAEVITSFGDRVASGERITPEEFDKSDYRLGIPWFELELKHIQREKGQ